MRAKAKRAMPGVSLRTGVLLPNGKYLRSTKCVRFGRFLLPSRVRLSHSGGRGTLLLFQRSLFGNFYERGNRRGHWRIVVVDRGDGKRRKTERALMTSLENNCLFCFVEGDVYFYFFFHQFLSSSSACKRFYLPSATV